MKLLIFVTLIALCSCEYTGYFWRPYNGTIPKDAVLGGQDEKNRTTYIGQSFFSGNSALLPSTITEDNAFAVAHLGPYFLKTPVNTKILCAAPDSQPIWKEVTFNKIRDYPGCNFIEGGYYNNAVLYIGRGLFDGRYITGKVFPPENEYYGFEVWNKGHIGHIEKFEMLGYCQDDVPKEE